MRCSKHNYRSVTDHRLTDALEAYAAANPVRFHMPGHKGVLSPLDVTELPGLDDLSHPQGVIAGIEARYQKACGSKASFLSVNGSTACVLAMFLALGEGKRVLLARDCHRSAVNGIALAGHTLTSLFPPYDATNRLSGMITAEQVDAALTASPADAVFITSPNYLGLCADVGAIANTVHRHGALLLVDGAHGAHFPFCDALPHFPAEQVDLWCGSIHKALPALTQCAVVHLGQRCLLPCEQVRKCLNLVQTSSPSYLLMASLEQALTQAQAWDWNAHLNRLLAVRANIRAMEGFSLLGDKPMPGVFAFDPCRLTIDVSGRGISGQTANQVLTDAGIYCEMADLYRIVLITTPIDSPQWYERLLFALSRLPRDSFSPPEWIDFPQGEPHSAFPFTASKPALSPRCALLAPSEPVPLSRTAFRVAAVAAGAYPPGVALFFPGEYISPEAAEWLMALCAQGFGLFGVENGCISCVKTQ